MIKEKEISILMRNNINFYREKGYECSYNEETMILVEDLGNSCKKKITAICECGSENVITYEKYLINKSRRGYYGCKKCSRKKAEETSIEKYGEKNYMMTEEGKKRVEDSNMKKYGVKTTLLEYKTKTKIENTNIEKYGTKVALGNKEVREKAFKGMEEKYGEKTYFKTKDFHNKLIEKYEKLISDDYEILNIVDGRFKIKHKKCDSMFDLAKDRIKYNIELCTVCNPISSNVGTSNNEKQIKEYLTEIGIDYICTDKTILKPKHLDVYIPEHNLAIEHNGFYYHDERMKSPNYHLNKTKGCEEKGIHLMHIWEDEWSDKRDIVKSIIRNHLGKIDNKIYARKCDIRYVDSKIVRDFLDNNHIQGFATSTYKLGLFHNNELVSLMTFGYRQINKKKTFELIRFCNKINSNVIGAASKLFKHFIKTHKNDIDTDEIVSFSEVRLFKGELYKQLGFKYKHRSRVDYYWSKNRTREHRWKYTKHKLVAEGYDKNMSEVEIMHMRGYNRIYGCGQDLYVYHIM